MTREVADLRLQLEEAALRSDAYLHAGYPDEAAEVAEEQRRLLSRFHARLRQSLSESAVEAEAERVLSAAPGVEQMAGAPRPGSDETPRVLSRVSRALVSALAAALLAALAVGTPGTDGGQLSATESPGPEAQPDVVALDAASRRSSPSPDDASTSPRSRPTRPMGGDAPTVAGRDEAARPEPSPTERIVGLVDGLVGAAEDAVRDALRALLDDSREAASDESRDDGGASTDPRTWDDADDADEPQADAPADDGASEPSGDTESDGAEDDPLTVPPELGSDDDPAAER